MYRVMEMEERAQLRILGSGTSTGVPLIGCDCPVCTSSDPRNQRLRCGFYISCQGFGLQIDTSEDFRQQALREKLPRVDAVVITHCHADHVFGLDELRRYNTMQKTRIPVYARPETVKDLRHLFAYIFEPKPLPGGIVMYRPELELHEQTEEAFTVGPFQLRLLKLPHGAFTSTAVEISFCGRRAVIASDCSAVPEAVKEAFSGAEIVLLDGLRDRKHAAHLTLEEAARVLSGSGAKNARLIHIGHDVLHEDICRRYGPAVLPAYDGEVLSL